MGWPMESVQGQARGIGQLCSCWEYSTTPKAAACPTSAAGQEPAGKGAGCYPSPGQRQQGAALCVCLESHRVGFGLHGAGPGKDCSRNASVAEQKHSTGC